MSKKIHVTMSKADYAALQESMRQRLEQRIRDSQANPRPERPNGKPPKQQPAKQSGGLDGFTLFCLILVAAMVALYFLPAGGQQ